MVERIRTAAAAETALGKRRALVIIDRVQDTATDALQRLVGVEQQNSSIALENANDSVAIEVGLEQSAIAS